MEDPAVDDRIDIATALDMLVKRPPAERPYATCTVDDEPLISTLEFRGAEFVCVVCGKRYGFLSPKPAAPTPELEARHAELLERYELERAARRSAEVAS